MFSLSKLAQKRFCSINMHNIFEKIVRRELKSEIVYEDDLALAFKDMNPIAPIHYLIIPKEKNNLSCIQNMHENQTNLLGHLLLVATYIAKEQKIEKGYRLVINNGEDGGQTVHHLHIHFLAGRQLGWPPVNFDQRKK